MPVARFFAGVGDFAVGAVAARFRGIRGGVFGEVFARG